VAALTIGVDVGGTKVLGVALDPSGSVVEQARAATPLAAHSTSISGGSDEGDAAEGVVDAVAIVVRIALEIRDGNSRPLSITAILFPFIRSLHAAPSRNGSISIWNGALGIRITLPCAKLAASQSQPC